MAKKAAPKKAAGKKAAVKRVKSPVKKTAGGRMKAAAGVAKAAGKGGVAMYGIPNCDTVRKARKWLDARGVACEFHDVRKEGVGAEEVARWVAALGGWEAVVNPRSTGYKNLTSAAQKALADEGSLAKALTKDATIMKRPLVVGDGICANGFSEAQYTALFA